jgi:hypothetical protein
VTSILHLSLYFRMSPQSPLTRTPTNYVAQRVAVSVLLVQHRNNRPYFGKLKLSSIIFYYLILRLLNDFV